MAKLFVNMNDLPVIYTRHRKSSKMLILVFVHIAMGHKQSFELAVPVLMVKVNIYLKNIYLVQDSANTLTG